MRFACIILLISAVAISADRNPNYRPVPAKFSDSEEFVDVVDYLNENASGNDLYEMIECFNDAMDDYVEPRSISSVVEEVFHEIPWSKIESYVEGKIASNPKFAKIDKMLKDPRFKELVNKALNSQALRNYLNSVKANGFSWSAFASFAMKAICDTAIVSHHDQYSEGICKALKNL